MIASVLILYGMMIALQFGAILLAWASLNSTWAKFFAVLALSGMANRRMTAFYLTATDSTRTVSESFDRLWTPLAISAFWFLALLFNYRSRQAKAHPQLP